MTTTTDRATMFLAEAGTGRLEVPTALHGFGGLHGGLALARLLSVMGPATERCRLQGITGHFHRPIRDHASLTARPLHTGTVVTSAWAEAVNDDGEPLATATAVFGADRNGHPAVLAAPRPPAAADPEAWDVFEVPVEFVPVAAATEIRPVGSNRPYAGGERPELTAWVRMVDDDVPPDEARLVFLLDALAPSWSAVLTAPVHVPTIELSVRPRAPLADATSPWVLLRASTTAVHGGWIDEHIDAWGPDGSYLGVARQLRLLR